MDQEPKIISPTEMEVYLGGTRREIDRLILEGLNNLTTAFIKFRDEEFRNHASEEVSKYAKISELAKAMGDEELIRARAMWIDAQIEAQRDRASMMRRVRDSVLIWVVIAFLGYMAVTAYNDFRSNAIKESKDASRPVAR